MHLAQRGARRGVAAQQAVELDDLRHDRARSGARAACPRSLGAGATPPRSSRAASSGAQRRGEHAASARGCRARRARRRRRRARRARPARSAMSTATTCGADRARTAPRAASIRAGSESRRRSRAAAIQPPLQPSAPTSVSSRSRAYFTSNSREPASLSVRRDLDLVLPRGQAAGLGDVELRRGGTVRRDAPGSTRSRAGRLRRSSARRSSTWGAAPSDSDRRVDRVVGREVRGGRRDALARVDRVAEVDAR